MDDQSRIDEDNEDELCFDLSDLDAELAALTAVPTPAPAPDIAPAEPAKDTPPPARRKRVAKGKAAAAPPPPPPAADDAPLIDISLIDLGMPPLPEPAAAPTPVETPPAPAPMESPAVTAPEAVEAPPQPPVAAPPASAPSRLMMIAIGVATFASLLSAIGLLVTSRNLATLHVAREEAENRQQALARLPALVARIDRLAQRQEQELAHAAAQRPADIVTASDLSRGLDGLRLALSKQQAPGTSALAGVVREGQTELSTRISQLQDRIDEVERGRGRH